MAVYYSDAIARLYFFQFIVYPLEYCQIIFHSISYGVYKKEVRKKLRKHYRCLKKIAAIMPKQGYNFKSSVIPCFIFTLLYVCFGVHAYMQMSYVLYVY